LKQAGTGSGLWWQAGSAKPYFQYMASVGITGVSQVTAGSNMQ